jgi:methylaspartate ammonia-lyase
MKILDVIASPGLTGFYADDQKAIKDGAVPDGFVYRGEPKTPGFSAIRQPGESVSVMLVLEDGQVAYGDCATVQYSGVGGRHPVFNAKTLVECIEGEWAGWLRGLSLEQFRPLAEQLDQLSIDSPAPNAIRYGISQALLDAVARTWRITMAEVISREYGAQLADKPVPIYAQTGDDLYLNVDKMILKQVGVLPHGLINNAERKVGREGEILLGYVRWLSERIPLLGGEDYKPRLHIDVYGTLGQVFNNDLDRLADYLGKVAAAASPYSIQIEGPLDAGSRSAQISELHSLRNKIKQKGINVPIVADEWCNTLEDIREFAAAEAADLIQIKTPSLGNIDNTIKALQLAQANGAYTYLGGSCNETDRSAQVCAHIALALQPNQMLAKPGMGVDEGLMIVYNEMKRALALISRRNLNNKKL